MLLKLVDPQTVRFLTRIGLAYFRLQHPDTKTYLLGHRIHHYTLGAGLEAFGKWYGYPRLSIIGQELKKDDIADKDEAFLFLTKEQEQARTLTNNKQTTTTKTSKLKRSRLFFSI